MFRLLSSRHVGGIRGHRQLGEFRCWNFCNLRRIRQGCKKLFPIRRKRACRLFPAERESTGTHSVSQTTLPPNREVSAKRTGINRIRQAGPKGPLHPSLGHRPRKHAPQPSRRADSPVHPFPAATIGRAFSPQRRGDPIPGPMAQAGMRWPFRPFPRGRVSSLASKLHRGLSAPVGPWRLSDCRSPRALPL